MKLNPYLEHKGCHVETNGCIVIIPYFWVHLLDSLVITYVPQIRPPFATLALVQSAGGAYTRDATFSLAIMPPLDREMLSSFVDADFVLALPFHHGVLEPDCVGVSTRGGGSRGRA